MSVLAVLLAMGLLAALQNWVYQKRWNKRLNLSLSFSETRATEGDPLYLLEVITNRKWLPLPWLSVKFQVSRHLWFDDRANARVSDDFYRHDLFNLFMFQRITRRLRFTCGKRGVYAIKSAELISGDILARRRFTQPQSCAATLTVYPRGLDADHYLYQHRQFLGEILTKRYIQPDPFTFRGIREYRPTDSLRSVNFNASAKTGELMVNMPDYSVSLEIVLILNLQPYSAYPREELYEQSIRLAASLAAFYIGSAVPLSFISNARAAVNGEGAAVESGAGQNHLTTLYEALAAIQLPLGVACPGAALLEEARQSQAAKRRTGREPAYILISPYYGRDIRDAFDTLCASGADALFIVAADADTDINIPWGERMVRVDL